MTSSMSSGRNSMCTWRFCLVEKVFPCVLTIARILKNPSFSCTPLFSSGSDFPFPSRGLNALLTEVNMTPAQLHPNIWAFVQAFVILYDYFSHPPSVDVFLYFFEVKNPGKKLWLSFNGVAGRVLLTLFQQSYKGFKKKFLKICCNIHDPTLLYGLPLYWVEKPRSLEDLTPSDRETCRLLSSLGMVFDTAELIELEFCAKVLKRYVGTFC